jgi:hypothetical protein
MAKPTVESLKTKTENLRKTLVEKGASLDADAARGLKKQVRRTQRMRRNLEAIAKRNAPKVAEAKAA